MAFELANHFAEWAGFECNYDLLPTTSTRLEFVHEYLEAYHEIKSVKLDSVDEPASSFGVAQTKIDQVMSEVDSFRGFPGFYWYVSRFANPTAPQID